MSIKKIAIVGPESTGKSALSAALAEHYNCHWVPEYAREYCGKLVGPCTYEDELNMFKGQLQLEDSLLKKSQQEGKSLLICDTIVLTVKIWTEEVLKIPTPFVLEELKNRKYDLFLLCNIDLPWEEDPQREFPHKREYFLELWKKELIDLNLNYTLISGLGEQRFNNAIKAIEKNLGLD